MNNDIILECILLITSLLPKLRDVLGLTQKEFSSLIGISRQSLIDLEHQDKKITKPVLIAIVSYFSLRKETAIILYNSNFYNNEFVQLLGFYPDVIRRIYKIKKEQNLNG